jgi:phospho-N-acetylmuramoyl-pentapeptide-transferase
MGTIGFIDDYIKIFKKDKQGLKGIFKVFGQVGLGLIWSCSLFQSCSNSANRYWKGDVFRVTTENVVTVSRLKKNLQPPRFL